MGRIEITHTKKMYGWSKWGGPNMGLLIEDLEEWACQACGSLQSKGLPSYMIPIDILLRDYCRVCSVCKNLALARKIEYMTTLTGFAKKNHVTKFTDLLENL